MDNSIYKKLLFTVLCANYNPIIILPFILQPQSSTAPPTEQDSDFDPVRVGMGVALGFLVAITMVIIAVTVAVMVVQRRRKRDAACGVQPSWGDGFTNAFYTGIYFLYSLQNNAMAALTTLVPSA